MAKVYFTQNLQRHISCPPMNVTAATVGAALHAVFACRPGLEGYILDDQGRLRKHVAVFVDGDMVKDRQALSDPLAENAEVYVVQALSGG